MSKPLKYSNKEALFFLSYFLLGFAEIVVLKSYIFVENKSQIYKMVLYLSAIFASLTFCMGRYKIKEIVWRLIILAIGFIITLQMRVIPFGISILLMVDALNIDSKKIIKNSVKNNLFYLAIVVIPSIVGAIPNNVYNHNGIYASCFGFQYYSTMPNLIFSLTIFIYLLANSKTKKRLVLLLSLPIQLIVYKYCTVRLILYVYFAFLILALMEERYDKNKKHKFISKMSAIMYPVTCIITFSISLLYTHYNVLTKLDELCNYRFGFNAIGFARYGISLFGSQIETDAGTIDSNYINHYFYIDSGYVYSLLCYGIIFFVLLIAMYSLYSKNVAKNNQSRLLVVCIIICIYSVVNNMLFSIVLNPLPLLAFQVIVNNRRMQSAQIVNSKKIFSDEIGR